MAYNSSFDAIIESLSSGRRAPNDREMTVADEEGWTVAHHWAQRKRLPLDFPHWELRDKDGWTVAHAAAQSRMLPDGFNQWLLSDNKGNTVAHIAVRSGAYDPKKFGEKIMMSRNNEGVTVWDEIKKCSRVKLEEVKRILES